MSRKRSQRMIVTRVTGEEGARRGARRPDELIVEEPMSIQLDGELVTTTMRTPGHDFELAAGFCHTDGLLDGAPITGVRYCADGSAMESAYNVVTVETGGRAPAPTARLGNVSSSCGWCGSEQLEHLCEQLDPLTPGPPLTAADLDVMAAVPARALAAQPLFDATGAVHAAAAFDRSGEVVLSREDVGRHNALDKLIGATLLDPTVAPPRTELGVFVSGRASIEMVYKAWSAGFHTLVAVSAPTALAVDAARRANLVLAGFLRGAEFNVYAPERLAP